MTDEEIEKRLPAKVVIAGYKDSKAASPISYRVADYDAALAQQTLARGKKAVAGAWAAASIGALDPQQLNAYRDYMAEAELQRDPYSRMSETQIQNAQALNMEATGRGIAHAMAGHQAITDYQNSLMEMTSKYYSMASREKNFGKTFNRIDSEYGRLDQMDADLENLIARFGLDRDGVDVQAARDYAAQARQAMDAAVYQNATQSLTNFITQIPQTANSPSSGVKAYVGQYEAMQKRLNESRAWMNQLDANIRRDEGLLGASDAERARYQQQLDALREERSVAAAATQEARAGGYDQATIDYFDQEERRIQSQIAQLPTEDKIIRMREQ